MDLAEILDRSGRDSIPEPLRVVETNVELIEIKQDGKLPIACMHPEAIRRDESIVTAIRFDTGLELETQDAIMLQDAGVLILPGYQLIHPKDGNPYYRAKADNDLANNFESLPEF